MRKLPLFSLAVMFSIVILSCSDSENQVSTKGAATSGFSKISASSGFDFTNILEETKLTNPFNYINLYMGGGVAIGDINNDGLQDIFLASNMSTSKLFLNKGNMKFEDITQKAGCSSVGWCTGVTMADINNDGWLDIYVCRSYHDDPTLRKNLALINNKNGTFKESGESLGIADENYSIGASFFDYDRDGDLDLIVANHPRFRFITLAQHYNYWKNPVKEFTSRLFRNDNGKFTETTVKSGVLSYGFCLSLTTSDFNADGWPDVFITVDHDEPDIILRNNQDGTFTNITDTALSCSSLSSMGIDAGDLNNDPYPEIVVAEMLAEDHYREKIIMGMQTVDRFNYLVDTMGYKYYQMHNFLYQNNSNNTFSDISQLAGVSKSDWSWSCLFWDFDNDGLQDISFTNGYYRDIFNRDNKNRLDSIMMANRGNMEIMNVEAQKYALNATQSRIENFLYRNQGELKFENVAKSVGLSDKTISTGAAYGDLDNDGDLDFVINNVGHPSSIYENTSSGNNYLRVNLKGNAKINALGSKVTLEYGAQSQHREILSTRGFQSSCELVAHFGLANVSVVDRLTITWPDGGIQVINNPKVNQELSIAYSPSSSLPASSLESKLVSVKNSSEIGIDFVHKENHYDDYADQVLLPHKLSEYGPFISKGDVNNDQQEDIYIGGAAGQAGGLFLRTESGTYKNSFQKSFVQDKAAEDGHSVFVDVDNDNDLDLIVTGTGYEFPENDSKYQPRLYLNNKGTFSKSKSAFAGHNYSSSCIKYADFDNDGDNDLFIGGRLQPKKYPNAGTSALFMNDGKENFANVTAEKGKEIEKCGMVKDAEWTDLNGDGFLDLMIVGEWMPISFYIQEDGAFIDRTESYMSTPLYGWWNCIEAADIDKDGLTDYVVGNLGYNYKYQASKDKPFTVYSNDYDDNGSCDIVLGSYYGDKMYPVRGRTCSAEQIPGLKKKFPTFEAYALADISKVYGAALEKSLKYEANEFGSLVLYQEKNNTYSPRVLPRGAQVAPINEVIPMDINKDGLVDLMVAGNLFQSEIETGKASAGTGHVLVNKGDRSFKVLSIAESGLYLPQDVKSMIRLDENRILVGANNDKAKVVVFDKL